MSCQRQLHAEGKPYPRTCDECGIIGPCRYVFQEERKVAADTSNTVMVAVRRDDLQRLLVYFKSGNSVEVERAVIPISVVRPLIEALSAGV